MGSKITAWRFGALLGVVDGVDRKVNMFVSSETNGLVSLN